MNFIAHDKAYCLYPRGTFKERCSLKVPLNALSAPGVAGFDLPAFERNGWTILTASNDDMLNDPKSAFAPGLRRVGDSKCWVIPVLPKLDDQSPESLVETNTWKLRHYARREPEMKIRSLLAAPNLRFHYTVGDAALEDYLSIKFHDEDDADGEKYVWFECTKIALLKTCAASSMAIYKRW